MKDILGKAVYDYHLGKRDEKLWIKNKYGAPEDMPISYYFRTDEEFPELELFALDHCKGKVLDIGAGAGAHSIILQDKGHKVTALDNSPLLVKTIKSRGIKQVVQSNIFEYDSKEKFDTLLLMMNGIGICGSIQGLEELLSHLKNLLSDNGQIIFDSSDITYLYDGRQKPIDRYFGEVDYQYSYLGNDGEWFSWVYFDFDTIRLVSENCGFQADFLAQDDQEHFLVRLTHK